MCSVLTLSLQLARAEDPLAQQKAELMFRENLPRWKVEMAARCTQDWRLAHLDRYTGAKEIGPTPST